MDLGFFRRSRTGTADSRPAELDYDMLTATLQAFQSASLTARMQAQGADRTGEAQPDNAALVELLLGGPDWREAIDRQGGSFNAAHARNKAE